MILPSKHLKPDRALLTVGGDILSVMSKETTVSTLWDEVRMARAKNENASPLPFDWFIMALTLLYAVDAITYRDGLLIKKMTR